LYFSLAFKIVPPAAGFFYFSYGRILLAPEFKLVFAVDGLGFGELFEGGF
jgi:hypothetical protein